MAGGKEIKTKINSVQNTQKITKAMEMVAASKMRKAQERMEAARPYADRIRRTIGHLARANPEEQHAFMVEREVRKVAYIVIATDRGLCGGLNINLFRRALSELAEWDAKGVKADIGIIGSKALAFFKRQGGRIVAETSNLGDSPHLDQLIGPVKVLLDQYRESKIDRLYMISNEFVSTMSQQPRATQLLPLEPVEDEELPDYWDYIYEPEAGELLDGILMRYIESQVFRGVLENVACEMAARMIAMKSASDNAEEIIEDLQLAYNKARQASITQELAEIVAGAEAV